MLHGNYFSHIFKLIQKRTLPLKFKKGYVIFIIHVREIFSTYVSRHFLYFFGSKII